MNDSIAAKRHKILNIIGIVLCVILVPILIVNCTLIIKSFVNKEEVPSFGGIMPLIVLTDSMYPQIKSGDIIIVKEIEPEDVNDEDVISFFDPEGNGTSIVTHQVIGINYDESGAIKSFNTKGKNNNTPDRLPVPAGNLVGRYTEIRIPGAGNVALFMQTTTGLIVCVIVPIILLVGYDLIRRRRYEKTSGNDVEALRAELEALKAANAKAATTQSVEDAIVEDDVEEVAVEPEPERVEAVDEPQESEAKTEDQNGVTKNENSSDT